MKRYCTALFAALLLVGCSGEGQTHRLGPSIVPTASLVWEIPVALIGDPVVTDQVIVGYMRTDTGMVLAGFDPHTGTQLWRRAAVPGGGTKGVSITASVVEHEDSVWTAAIAGTGTGRHQVFILDARTGSSLALPSLSIWALSRPTACPDDAVAFCLRAWLPDEGREAELRADPRALTLTADPSRDTGGEARFLGRHVYSTNDRPATGGIEMLGYQRDGEQVWERPYTDVFGPNSSSDQGWHWHDDDAASTIVGLGHPAREHSAGQRIPAGEGTVVGLDPATGATRWAVPGAEHCPMELDATPSPSVVAACLMSGTLGVPAPTDDNPTHDDLITELAGIERDTGELLWRQPIAWEHFTREWAFVPRGTEVVVRTPEGTALVVDLTSGATRRAKTELACERRRADVTLQYGDEPAEFYAGLGRYPCDRTGRETGAWTPASLAWAGEEVGGLLIVAGLETLSAYRVG